MTKRKQIVLSKLSMKNTMPKEMLECAAARLRESRMKAGYGTAIEFVRAKNLEEATYRHHENGTRGIDPFTAIKYGSLLNVSGWWLLSGERNQKIEPKGLLKLAATVSPYLTIRECPDCEIPLVRVPKSIAIDKIVCIQCGNAGSYKKVIENKGGIEAGVLTKEQLASVRKSFGIFDE